MVGNNTTKAVSPKFLHHRSTAISTNPPSNQVSPTTESPLKQEVNSSKERKTPEAIITTKEEFRENSTGSDVKIRG